jgi:hypothetical protein
MRVYNVQVFLILVLRTRCHGMRIANKIVQHFNFKKQQQAKPSELFSLVMSEIEENLIGVESNEASRWLKDFYFLFRYFKYLIVFFPDPIFAGLLIIL